MATAKKRELRRLTFCPNCNSEHAGDCPGEEAILARAAQIREGWRADRFDAAEPARIPELPEAVFTDRARYTSSFND